MLCHPIYIQVVKVHLFNLGLLMNRYTFVLPSENQNTFPLLSICANAVCNVIQSLKDISSRNFEMRRRVLRVKKKYEIQKEHISLSLSLSLSLYLSICRCTLISRKDMHVPTSLSFSLSLSLFTFAKTVWIQIRPERNSGKLKICACYRKYAKCRTKADAHDKVGFQYISISVDIVRSHARIQRGDRGSGPPP